MSYGISQSKNILNCGKQISVGKTKAGTLKISA
jgi:hypothetical protein